MRNHYFLAKVLMAAVFCFTTAAQAGAQATGEGNTTFYESFNKINDKGGNDGHTNNYTDETGAEVEIASFDIDDTNYADYLDNATLTGWAFEKVAGCDRCVRLGTKKKNGSLTTPAVGLEGDGTLTFNAIAQSGDNVTVYVEILNGGTLSYKDQKSAKINIALPESTEPATTPLAQSVYTVSISGATANSQLVFSCISSSADKQRFFLDEIRVVKGGTTGINAVKTDAKKAEGVYTLAGQKLNATSTKALPQGIYIVNGKKVIK